MPDDKPYRVIFPEPKVLHGSDVNALRQRAIDFLRTCPEEIRVEPLYEPEKPTQ